MFVGVPLFAVIYDITRDIVNDTLEKRNISSKEE